MNPLLENRRNDNAPKCANCGWWRGGEAPAGHCERHDTRTLDLAVCSDHRDGEPVVDVLPPDDMRT